MATTTLERPRIATPAEWLAARKALLKKEKELTHLRDTLAAERQALPWVRVEKNYVFDAPGGKESLADLFDGRSQLAVYHFMFGPDWAEGCPSCSMVADGFDGSIVHIAQRDVSFAAISRARLPKIEAFNQRMGCRLPWVSSSATTIATPTATWPMRLGLTGPHSKRRILRRRSVPPLPKQTLPAATAKTTNLFFIDSNQPDDTELLVAGVTGSVKK